MRYEHHPSGGVPFVRQPADQDKTDKFGASDPCGSDAPKRDPHGLVLCWLHNGVEFGKIEKLMK